MKYDSRVLIQPHVRKLKAKNHIITHEEEEENRKLEQKRNKNKQNGCQDTWRLLGDDLFHV